MGNAQNAQNKPPPDYVRPSLTKEELKKLDAYVDDERRNQLSEEEQQKKCGAAGRYEKPCPDPIEVCRPRSKEPEFVCAGEKKGDRLPPCLESKPLQKPPQCPADDESPCTSDDVIGAAVLYKKEEEKKRQKNSGAYNCEPDDDDDDPC